MKLKLLIVAVLVVAALAGRHGEHGRTEHGHRHHEHGHHHREHSEHGHHHREHSEHGHHHHHHEHSEHGHHRDEHISTIPSPPINLPPSPLPTACLLACTIGQECSDNNPCTLNDTCVATREGNLCIGLKPKRCGPAPNECHFSAVWEPDCELNECRCRYSFKPAGASCRHRHGVCDGEGRCVGRRLAERLAPEWYSEHTEESSEHVRRHHEHGRLSEVVEEEEQAEESSEHGHEHGRREHARHEHVRREHGRRLSRGRFEHGEHGEHAEHGRREHSGIRIRRIPSPILGGEESSEGSESSESSESSLPSIRIGEPSIRVEHSEESSGEHGIAIQP